MDEPGRIGLSQEANSYLDDLLMELNPDDGAEGVKLIKFDLYRLAVALGIKNKIDPPVLDEKSSSSFRIQELDPDGILYTVVESTGIVKENDSVYLFIERLAEDGIRKFYDMYNQTGQLPLEEIFAK